MDDLAAACKEAVLAVFPDICPDYLQSISAENEHNQERTITHILDQSENGIAYPTRQRSGQKRKRQSPDGEAEEDADAEIERMNMLLANPDRQEMRNNWRYLRSLKQLLMQEFPLLRAKTVHQIMIECGHELVPILLALEEASASRDRSALMKHQRTKTHPTWEAHRIKETIETTNDKVVRSMLEDFLAATEVLRLLRLRESAAGVRQSKLDDEMHRQQEENENMAQAMADGDVTDCGCCFEKHALNRMVHCDGDVLHWFCYDCARKMAETQIGLSKYQLACMSMDGCGGGFSRGQRNLFLTPKLVVALDRIEQEAVLRMAGIENLESCPFCPFAAEYPPVEEDKEFTCQNPECEVVSCRMCRQETHIPKSCEESARESGLSARRKIEEAMSAALIRNCNKCKTPFIKENGCNKMTCTRNGCQNVQCYICHMSCDYSHFDDISRGGKVGNCPLFDPSVEQRHEDEVRAAEERARKAVVEDNPDVDANLLDIKVSDKVKQDDERRKTFHQGLVRLPLPVPREGPFAAAVPAAPPQPPPVAPPFPAYRFANPPALIQPQDIAPARHAVPVADMGVGHVPFPRPPVPPADMGDLPGGLLFGRQPAPPNANWPGIQGRLFEGQNGARKMLPGHGQPRVDNPKAARALPFGSPPPNRPPPKGEAAQRMRARLGETVLRQPIEAPVLRRPDRLGDELRERPRHSQRHRALENVLVPARLGGLGGNRQPERAGFVAPRPAPFAAPPRPRAEDFRTVRITAAGLVRSPPRGPAGFEEQE